MHDKGIQIKNDSAKIKVEKFKLLKGILNIVKDVSSVTGLGSLPIHAIDTIESFKLKDDSGSIAWKLICISLTDSLRTLISEANLDLCKDIIVTDDLENDLITKLESGEYYINPDFFKNPGKIPLINDLKPIFTEFLALFELKSFEIENILNRLPSYFVFSLAKEWRKNYKYYSILEEHIHTPFDEAVKNEEGWFLYLQWIKQQIDRPVFSESFSLRQVYIPLRAYYNIKPQDRNKVKADIEIKQEEPKRYVVDLEKELLDWLIRSDKDDAIRIIRGGPGIGKSSFLKMFAAKLVDEVRKVLFIPLHLFEIQDNLIDAVKNFLKYDDFIDEDPFKTDRLIIIFDGLDELAMQGKVLAEAANQFLQEVERKVTKLNNQKIKLQCIISGRDVVVQQNESSFRNEGQILRLIPYLIQDKEKEKFIDKEKLLRIDQRDLWWKQYGQLNGKYYEKLPDILNDHELDEITAQPLLNYLVALSFERGKIDFSQNTNLNNIYLDLLDAVYLRNYSEGKDQPILKLEQKDFNRMLEEIALAAWHGDGRTTTVSEIEKHFEEGRLKSILDNFLKDAEKGVVSLLSAFYFRQSGYSANGSQTFEFTHKSFGEYLTSKRIVNKLIQINDNHNLRISNYDQGWDVKQCLVEWIKIFGPKEIDSDLVKFIFNEIELYYISKSEMIVQMQQTIIKLINHTLKYGLPLEKIDPRLNYYEENKQAINTERALLLILGSISKFTKDVSEIQFPQNTTFGEWMSKLIGQRSDSPILFLNYLHYLNLSNSILIGRDLSYANFDNSDLSNSDLSFANLFSTMFRCATLINTKFVLSNLSVANFIDANLSNSDFTLSILDFTTLINTKLINTKMSVTRFNLVDLSDADLSNAELTNSNLGITNLSHANLKNIKLVSSLSNREETKDDIIEFITNLEEIPIVEGIQLDDKILEIIKSDFPDLYKRIQEGEPKK